MQKYVHRGAVVVVIVYSWIYNYLCNQYLSPLTLWVRIPLRWGVLDTTLYDQVCQWLATGRWFSLGTPVSSDNKTDRHDIAEILLKVVLNTITPNPCTWKEHISSDFYFVIGDKGKHCPLFWVKQAIVIDFATERSDIWRVIYWLLKGGCWPINIHLSTGTSDKIPWSQSTLFLFQPTSAVFEFYVNYSSCVTHFFLTEKIRY
jgi:hypothetical protein